MVIWAWQTEDSAPHTAAAANRTAREETPFPRPRRFLIISSGQLCRKYSALYGYGMRQFAHDARKKSLKRQKGFDKSFVSAHLSKPPLDAV
jgi:hypothetical protein